MSLKRFIATAVVFWLPAACFAGAADLAPVEAAIHDVEKRLSAQVGVAILDTGSNALWNYQGERRFAMASTFKTLACATLLKHAEHDAALLDTKVPVRREALVSYSPVIERHVGQSISLRQACTATMQMSDNTAANLVLEAVGGPAAVTAFLREQGDAVTRLDRNEPRVNEARPGDPRDTTTPEAMTRTLQRLLFGPALSADSRQQLLQWMRDNQVSGSLLRSVLPSGWQIADRSGAGGFGARGITAVLWQDSRAPLIVSLYLGQTEATLVERDQAIAEIGRAIFAAYASTSP